MSASFACFVLSLGLLFQVFIGETKISGNKGGVTAYGCKISDYFCTCWSEKNVNTTDMCMGLNQSELLTSDRCNMCTPDTFPPPTTTVVIMPSCASSSVDAATSEQAPSYDIFSHITTTVCMESCNSDSAVVTSDNHQPKYFSDAWSPSISTTRVMQTCSGASTNAWASVTIASVTIVIITLTAAALLVIYFRMRMKRQVSCSCDHSMTLMNEPVGGNSTEICTVQESISEAKEIMGSRQKNTGIQDHTSNTIVANVCLQHTYAILEPPPISTNTHPPTSFCKQGQVDNPLYSPAASSSKPTCDQQSQNEADLASDYLVPVSTLGVPLTKNEKIEATNNHSMDTYDHTYCIEHDHGASQNSELPHAPKLGDTADEETSTSHDYAILDATSNKK